MDFKTWEEIFKQNAKLWFLIILSLIFSSTFFLFYFNYHLNIQQYLTKIYYHFSTHPLGSDRSGLPDLAAIENRFYACQGKPVWPQRLSAMFILILLFFNGNVPLLHVGPESLLVISVFKMSAIHFFVYPFAKYLLRYLKLIFPKKLMYRMLEEILQNNLFSQFSVNLNYLLIIVWLELIILHLSLMSFARSFWRLKLVFAGVFI